MNRLLAVFALIVLLVSCQPVVQDAVTNEYNERLGHPGVEYTMTVDERGFVVVSLEYGELVLVDTAIAVRADSLTFNSTSCMVVTGGVDCKPGELETLGDGAVRVLRPERSPFNLYFRGSNIVSNVSFYVLEDGEIGRFYSELFVVE